MVSIPESYHDFFAERTFAHVATLMADGTPQVTPVWVDYDFDDDRLRINTARGRVKERNVARDPKVGVSMLDPDDPYHYLSIRGVVDEVTEEGAVEHIHELARRYTDADRYTNLDQESGARVIMRIRPDHVVTG